MEDDNPLARRLMPAARLGTIACGWVLVVLSVFTGIEILMRKMHLGSIQGLDEIGGYVLTFVTAFGCSAALLQRGHTRVDFAFSKLPPGATAILNAIAAVTFALFAGFTAWEAGKVLAESIELRSRATTPLQTPLWIPQGIWMAGLLLFAGIAAAMALHAGWLLLRDRARLNQLYGPLSLEGQIDLETQGALHHEEAEKAGR